MDTIKQRQRVEILAEQLRRGQGGGGGGTSDAYTKAEADAKFQTISGMSGYVPQSTNYFTVNGIRVYVSSTAPTGDIPAGSIGLGW